MSFKEVEFSLRENLNLEKIAPYEIVIHTYEYSEKIQDWKPILSHIFYGQTPEEAMAYAKSHLKTDYFFSSSFIGQMEWKNAEILHIQNTGLVIAHKKILDKKNTLQELVAEAKKIHKKQEKEGMFLVIQTLF